MSQSSQMFADTKRWDLPRHEEDIGLNLEQGFLEYETSIGEQLDLSIHQSFSENSISICFCQD